MSKHIQLPTYSESGKYKFYLETEKHDRSALSGRINSIQSTNLSARFQIALNKKQAIEKIKAIGKF